MQAVKCNLNEVFPRNAILNYDLLLQIITIKQHLITFSILHFESISLCTQVKFAKRQILETDLPDPKIQVHLESNVK